MALYKKLIDASKSCLRWKELPVQLTSFLSHYLRVGKVCFASRSLILSHLVLVGVLWEPQAWLVIRDTKYYSTTFLTSL
jgi:hypothetical protein